MHVDLKPPLQYYVRAIQDQEWDRVDVVTNGIVDETHAINPIVPALEAKVAKGQLLGNIHFHKVRRRVQTVAVNPSSSFC